MEPTYEFKGKKVEVLVKGGNLWKIKLDEDREFWVPRIKVKIKLPPKPKVKKIVESIIVPEVIVAGVE